MEQSPVRSSCFQKYSRIGTLAVFSCIAGAMHAQTVYGNIRGTVTGKSGQPVSNATITVVSVEKGSKQKVTSNRSGFFSVSHLLPDTYNITAEATGYGKCDVIGEDVYADQTVSEEFQLDQCVGSKNASAVETTTLLKTDRADVSTTLSGLEIRNLPNFTRNFTAFELLTPGAVSYPIAENTARANQNPQAGLQIDQNGQHYGGSAFQLDGTDNRDPIAGLIVINPTLESISEIKITTQNFDAEFGQALGGLVTAHTRSGSNVWHGSLFEFRNSDWAQASPPHLNNANVMTNPFKSNRFGGSIGGPLIASRLFIFGDYQGNRRATDVTKFANVPTALAHNSCLDATVDCDLSDYKTPFCPVAIQQSGPCQTGVMTIPHTSVAQQSQNLLALLPCPNVLTPPVTMVPNAPCPNVASAPTVQNYQATQAAPQSDDTFNIRIDLSASAKLKLFSRYSFFDSRLDAGAVFGGVIGGIGVSQDNFAGTSRSRDHSISAGLDYLFSPSLTTDFRFGFYRYHVNVLQGGLGSTPASDAGIQGLNLGDSYTSGMPGIVITQPKVAVTSDILLGYAQQVNNCNCPLLENEQQFQWANNWTKLHENHTFKWGVDFRYARNLRVSSERHRAGELTFSPQTTAVLNTSGSGLGLASFLIGAASGFSRYYDPNDDYSAGERQHRYFFYGQDTWRISSRFTLSYGLRWEIYRPQSVSGAGQGGFLDPITGIMHVAGYGGTNLQGNVKTDPNDFAPRVGFAYHFLPKTVLRAAYGRSYDLGSLGAVFGDSVTQNSPVLDWEQFPPSFPGQEVYDLRTEAPQLNPSIVNGQISPSELKNIAANVVPRTMVIPTIDTWNVSLQQQVNSSTSFELAYVANKGTHVFPGESSNSVKNASYNLNQPTLQGFEYEGGDSTQCQPGSGSGTPTSPCAWLAKYRQPYYSMFGWQQAVSFFGNRASSTYESLQFKLDKRFTHGFQYDAAYTLSRGTGFVEDYFAVDPHINYGPNDFDRTHAFTLSTLWDLPVGRGKALMGGANRGLDRVIGGWAVNTVSYVYSGFPFTPTYNNSECSKDVDTGPCRPNRYGPVEISGKRTGWFTPVPSGCPFASNSFSTPGAICGPWQRPPHGVFGTAGRNSLRGPTFFDTDLALLKDVTVTERVALQFRAEVANLFNRVNLGMPNACVDCGPGISGVISNLATGASMRQFLFALRLQF